MLQLNCFLVSLLLSGDFIAGGIASQNPSISDIELASPEEDFAAYRHLQQDDTYDTYEDVLYPDESPEPPQPPQCTPCKAVSETGPIDACSSIETACACSLAPECAWNPCSETDEAKCVAPTIGGKKCYDWAVVPDGWKQPLSDHDSFRECPSVTHSSFLQEVGYPNNPAAPGPGQQCARLWVNPDGMSQVSAYCSPEVQLFGAPSTACVYCVEDPLELTFTLQKPAEMEPEKPIQPVSGEFDKSHFVEAAAEEDKEGTYKKDVAPGGFDAEFATSLARQIGHSMSPGRISVVDKSQSFLKDFGEITIQVQPSTDPKEGPALKDVFDHVKDMVESKTLWSIARKKLAMGGFSSDPTSMMKTGILDDMGGMDWKWLYDLTVVPVVFSYQHPAPIEIDDQFKIEFSHGMGMPLDRLEFELDQVDPSKVYITIIDTPRQAMGINELAASDLMAVVLANPGVSDPLTPEEPTSTSTNEGAEGIRAPLVFPTLCWDNYYFLSDLTGYCSPEKCNDDPAIPYICQHSCMTEFETLMGYSACTDVPSFGPVSPIPGCHGNLPLSNQTSCSKECAGLAFIPSDGICTGCKDDGRTPITWDNWEDEDMCWGADSDEGLRAIIPSVHPNPSIDVSQVTCGDYANLCSLPTHFGEALRSQVCKDTCVNGEGDEDMMCTDFDNLALSHFGDVCSKVTDCTLKADGLTEMKPGLVSGICGKQCGTAEMCDGGSGGFFGGETPLPALTPGCDGQPSVTADGCSDPDCSGLYYFSSAGICIGCMSDGVTRIMNDTTGGEYCPPPIPVAGGGRRRKLSQKRQQHPFRGTGVQLGKKNKKFKVESGSVCTPLDSIKPSPTCQNCRDTNFYRLDEDDQRCFAPVCTSQCLSLMPEEFDLHFATPDNLCDCFECYTQMYKARQGQLIPSPVFEHISKANANSMCNRGTRKKGSKKLSP